jgi:hypothetical protein
METDAALLDNLQRQAFSYFVHEYNPANGLIRDKTAPDWPASIAAVGLALASYPVGVERGLMTRAVALARTHTPPRSRAERPLGSSADASGYKGFFYHFLDMQTGRRFWSCELSTVDTAFLIAGVLTAGCYFSKDTPDESAVRELAEQLYERVDWQWALNGGATLTHGWTPERLFLPYRWEGYSEGLLLYVLALGSPTHALPSESYGAWASTYSWKELYGYELLYAGSLFEHQLSHIWIDFRKIQDQAMREHGSDYFENSRRATYVQQRYAIENPQAFQGYGQYCWGITASDGPGDTTSRIAGVERQFYDYRSRGVPYGPDDGTIAPWAVVASLPFAPEIVLPTIRYFDELELRFGLPYGYKATFNLTFSSQTSQRKAWISRYHFGINQGPITMMIENYRANFIWELMRSCAPLQDGLRKCGFQGGYL